jgi:hypothetical protein
MTDYAQQYLNQNDNMKTPIREKNSIFKSSAITIDYVPTDKSERSKTSLHFNDSDDFRGYSFDNNNNDLNNASNFDKLQLSASSTSLSSRSSSRSPALSTGDDQLTEHVDDQLIEQEIMANSNDSSSSQIPVFIFFIFFIC